MTDRILSGSRIVEIQHGDTLQVIAARELGDASKWVDIVSVNGLRPPYLTGVAGEASASVKLYGQTLVVPAASTVPSSVNDADQLFGVDLDLSGGALSVESGDLKLAGGRANLRQALVHHIVTDLQELLFHLRYGCGVRRLLGAVAGPASGLLAAEYVRTAIRMDTRVAAVISTTADVVGDQVVVTARIQPITGTTIDIAATV